MSGETKREKRLPLAWDWGWYPTKEGMKEAYRQTLEYEEVVRKSEGFDVGGLTAPDLCRGLMEYICSNDTCCRIVLLYARMGLHRYNLLQGKNLELISVTKYNQTTFSAACGYYITLEAMDPATNSPLTFQTRVQELQSGKLVLLCAIARPLGGTNLGDIKRSSDYKPVKNFFLSNTIPQWPPEDPFENSKRCRVLEKSEVQENDDWIRLYLELAVATTIRNSVKNHDLSKLKIVKVAVDTSTQDVEEGLKNSKHFVIVYIRYKDPCVDALLGNHVVDRLAIVRRTFNEQHGTFSLVGQILTRDIIPKQKLKLRRRTSSQLWFSLRLRWRLSGLGLSRRVHTKRSIRLPSLGLRKSTPTKNKVSETELVMVS
ncbi:unnamed protein product [Microthlaspi erraticum]|uniref:Uncharacterized protein n=1 Tax=Microthlaspi erraticum TaxID=1685480 RepID=A0A6D2KCV3_9BRAS|nr:unnamed protein product [Microthlaspi erraticum]CAA7049663.1 unnamed protein product [Microthlaspi erraticum]